MAKRTLWLMGMWLGALTAAQTADMLVAVYVQGQRVPMQPAARVRQGVTYGPLRATAEAVGAHVEWDARARVANVCLQDRCVPIRASQGLIVEGALLIPVRLLSEALGRRVIWNPKARAIYIY